MSGGPNNTKKPRTGAPPGFTHGGGASQMALQSFVNPTTGQKWTASHGGWQAPEGWEAYDDGGWDQNMKKIPGKHEGQEWTEWKDPNAPPKYGGLNPGGGGFGDWNPGGQPGMWGTKEGSGTTMNPGSAGQWGGLLGGGQQAIKYPSMNIPGLLQYHTIDN